MVKLSETVGVSGNSIDLIIVNSRLCYKLMNLMTSAIYSLKCSTETQIQNPLLQIAYATSMWLPQKGLCHMWSRYIPAHWCQFVRLFIRNAAAEGHSGAQASLFFFKIICFLDLLASGGGDESNRSHTEHKMQPGVNLLCCSFYNDLMLTKI